MNATSPTSGDFVRAQGGYLRDATGRRLLLRGVGLGNWLLPEGYMWGFGQGGPDSPHQIAAFLADLVGPDQAGQFWAAFRRHFIAESDVAAIAAMGFDHVRLPINAWVLAENDLVGNGQQCIDDLIEWCRKYDLRVLLDLHGAPGGQTGTNIDDSPNGRPELFENPSYAEQTVALWTGLAERYAWDPAVLGYDLLNEPLPQEWQHRYPDRLVALYRDLTAAIRAVDPNHLIMYEGTGWATNWDIFTEVWDDNSALQFHKYWSPPDRPSLAPYLEARQRLGLPIYVGESGENSPGWLATAFGLYEDAEISWAFWTWKKMATQTSPWSVDPPLGWDDILAFASGQGPRPTADDAARCLTDLAEAMRIENCQPRPDVVGGLFRRPPVTLPPAAFGFRGEGQSYRGRAAPHHHVFRQDEATIRVHWTGPGQPDWALVEGQAPRTEWGFVVLLGSGEWVSYHIEHPSDDRLRVGLVVGRGKPVVTWGGMPVELTETEPEMWTGQLPALPVVAHGERVELRVGAPLGPPARAIALRSIAIGPLQDG